MLPSAEPEWLLAWGYCQWSKMMLDYWQPENLAGYRDAYSISDVLLNTTLPQASCTVQNFLLDLSCLP